MWIPNFYSQILKNIDKNIRGWNHWKNKNIQPGRKIRCSDKKKGVLSINFFLPIVLFKGNHMKATIETLKDNLKKKSRENRELEMKIRQEVTEEMAQQLVRIQEEADERVAEAQVRRAWLLAVDWRPLFENDT